jgi:hypothetical protein
MTIQHDAALARIDEMHRAAASHRRLETRAETKRHRRPGVSLLAIPHPLLAIPQWQRLTSKGDNA